MRRHGSTTHGWRHDRMDSLSDVAERMQPRPWCSRRADVYLITVCVSANETDPRLTRQWRHHLDSSHLISAAAPCYVLQFDLDCITQATCSISLNAADIAFVDVLNLNNVKSKHPPLCSIRCWLQWHKPSVTYLSLYSVTLKISETLNSHCERRAKVARRSLVQTATPARVMLPQLDLLLRLKTRPPRPPWPHPRHHHHHHHHHQQHLICQTVQLNTKVTKETWNIWQAARTGNSPTKLIARDRQAQSNNQWLEQLAQLSQRDRAAGLCSKVEDWNWETIYYGHNWKPCRWCPCMQWYAT